MKYLQIILLAYLLVGCEYVIGTSEGEKESQFKEMNIPMDFDFLTTQNVDLIFPSSHTNHLAALYSVSINDTSFLGHFFLEGEQLALELDITTTSVYSIPVGISGNGDYRFDFVHTQTESKTKEIALEGYYTMGEWNSSGVPDYLISPDELDNSLTNDIGVTLPEGRPVPTYSPEYLNGLDMNTVINDNADVWVTFVHEGAGYRNVLGYFSYDSNNPPATVNEVDSLTIVFPNVSYNGSGGGLTMGDKVHLGRFEAGTSIAWFLMPNAWNWRSSEIQNVADIKYSINDFNDFTADEAKIITRVVFTSPVPENTINKYDPFMVTEFNRGNEIHLPGQQPTSKADLTLFGTKDDASNFESGFTYKNSEGLPWALHVMESIKYPTENTDFANAYYNFRNWAESSGVTHTDWFYQNKSNMNTGLFYSNN